MILELLRNFFGHKIAKDLNPEQNEFQKLGIELKKNIDSVFGRSLAIRELDSGSDNAAEIELNNLSTPYYDIERYAYPLWLRPGMPISS
jgi:hypothetical protein